MNMQKKITITKYFRMRFIYGLVSLYAIILHFYNVRIGVQIRNSLSFTTPQIVVE